MKNTNFILATGFIKVVAVLYDILDTLRNKK